MLEGWQVNTNIATKTAMELLNKYVRERHERLFKKQEEQKEKEYRQCVKCSQHHRKSIHHINDMLPVQRDQKDRHGVVREWTVYYCYKYGCAQGYKPHKKRAGGKNY